MEQKEYWVIIGNKKVVVTEEVYRAYMRPEWRERKNNERRSRCSAEGGNRCTGDCSVCGFFRSGTPVSMDVLRENGGDIADSSAAVEDEVMKKELITAMYREIEGLPEKERRAVILFSRGKTGREIGAELGISQQAVSKMLGRVWPRLAEKLKGWR